MSEMYYDPEEQTCCGQCGLCFPWLRDMPITDRLTCCPWFTYADLFWLISAVAMILMFYGLCLMYIGEPIEPGGPLFGLYALVVFAYFLGWFLASVPRLHLPPVVGMMLAGMLVRNFNWYNIHEELGTPLTSKLRTFAVTFIMLRAGLQLTSTALREHPLSLIELAVVPCTMEMLAVAVCCYFVLGYSWIWGFLAGSIIACISPVVTINCVLALSDRGYGEDKEIAPLIFTAASIDDIHIVSVYSICYGFIFTHDKDYDQWWTYIPGGLRDLVFGATIGIVLGFFFIFFPHRTQKNLMWYRLFELLIGSLLCTSATTRVWLTGGAFLATIIMAFLATTGWRILTVPFDVNPMRKAVFVMWHFMQPLLIGIIGADVDLSSWSMSRIVMHLVCISIGALVRIGFAYVATGNTPYNPKERLFIAISWIAKGTLQAALAPMSLEQAKAHKDAELTKTAQDVVQLAIISILFLAPLGSFVMMMSGPLLLTKSTAEEVNKRRELSYARILSFQPHANQQLQT